MLLYVSLTIDCQEFFFRSELVEPDLGSHSWRQLHFSFHSRGTMEASVSAGMVSILQHCPSRKAMPV